MRRIPFPCPGDLNAIEIAVWAAEYVRVRAERRSTVGFAVDDDIADAADEANRAVDDLRRVRERS